MNMTKSQPDVFFQHDINLLLKLEAEKDEVEINAGNIERVSLELHSYGFIGTIQFSGVDNDDLVGLYDSKKETKATLTYQSSNPLDGGKPLLEIKGIVIRKSYTRVDTHLKVNAHAVRHYEIVICDHAQATWSEHSPTQIYVDESMKDVVEANKNPSLSIQYDFSPLDRKYPIIAFSLASNPALPPSEHHHFYSFLNWYLHHENGIWNYDYKKNTYSILSKKPPLQGEAFKIKEDWVAPPQCLCEKPTRYHVHTLKHSADSLDSDSKERETAFKSVHKDVIAKESYTAFPEHAYEPVLSISEPQHPEVEVEAVHLRDGFEIDKLIPGSYVKFSAEGPVENWTDDDFFLGKTFRSRVLFFEAFKVGLTEKLDKPNQTYQVYIKTLLEPQEETYVERPYFCSPTFPFTIQGKVSSDIGDKEQSTYKIPESESHPQGHYLVSVPLAKHKNVVVPFTPDFMTGQYYFPLCKGERVLLSMYFHTAKIERVIDWQPLARLPAGVQGNQIVLSSNGKDKYAIIRHEFEEGSDSVITIQQATSETQSQTIQIRDKDLCIVVNETDTKRLILHLNGDQGVTLSLEDSANQKMQQIIFDGNQIISTCQDSAETSTYVQKPDSIAVTCKQFNVDAEKIFLKAKDTITQVGEVMVDIETAIANIKAGAVKMG